MNRKSFVRISLLSMMLFGLILFVSASTVGASGRNQTTILTLSFDNLEDLGEGFVYEGWAIVDGAPLSTGIFTVNENGKLSQRNFSVDSHRNQIDAIVLTIEPYPDPDPAPSDTHVLAGDVNKRRAELTTGHPAALGNDFQSAAGRYILAVPSDGSGSTPYTNGIWWLDPAAGPGAGLDLPTLPAGWVYEGWVVGDSGPISTGTFTDVAAADSDAGGPYAGPDGTPPFPGQDFVTPPTNLVGHTAVISIEPYPDNSPAPFTFKPLVDAIDDPGAPGVTQEMSNNADGFPTGWARLSRGFRYQVTLENLTDGQPFSPPVAITHRRSSQMFVPNNRNALAAIEAIAEDGDPSLAVDHFSGKRFVSDVVNVGMPLTPHGTTVGDFTDTVTFEIVARRGDRLSLAGMLICTNDGLVIASDAALPQHGSVNYYLNGFDAGTEDNTELSHDIVDACSALGPVVLDGDPNGNENDVVNTHPAGDIVWHPGIAGDGDLLDVHDWDGAVAKLTIERID